MVIEEEEGGGDGGRGLEIGGRGLVDVSFGDGGTGSGGEVGLSDGFEVGEERGDMGVL